jgi:hypothetical protein
MTVSLWDIEQSQLMLVVNVTLTERYKHRKNENKIVFEEDSASKSADLIGDGRMRSVGGMIR